MKRIPVIQLGIGNVGREVVRQIQFFNNHATDVSFQYLGIASSKLSLFEKDGIPEPLLVEMISSQEMHSLESIADTEDHDGNISPFISHFSQTDFSKITIIDTTDSTSHIQFLMQCVGQGASLVLANKKPLVGDMESFNYLNRTKLGCRATVGAGLPVIPVLTDQLSKGETIRKIEGCFSGSLGNLCSYLETGETFSSIIKELQEKGFTEPDPREDLSGKDLARKILILSRLAGYNISLNEIQIESLFPAEMTGLSSEEFLSSLTIMDNEYRDKFSQASQKNCTLRVVATFDKNECHVGLKEVPHDSLIGKLTGAEKLAVIYTENENNNPIVVRGEGAGAVNAAKDVFNDLLEVNQLDGI